MRRLDVLEQDFIERFRELNGEDKREVCALVRLRTEQARMRASGQFRLIRDEPSKGRVLSIVRPELEPA